MATKKYVSLNRLQNFKDKITETIPTKLSELENDAGFVTNVTGGGIIYELSKDGNRIILSGSDGSTTSVTDENTIIEVDSEFSDVSTNPVQNKIIKQELDNKVDKVDGMGLSTNDYTNEDKLQVETNKSDILSLQEDVEKLNSISSITTDAIDSLFTS